MEKIRLYDIVLVMYGHAYVEVERILNKKKGKKEMLFKGKFRDIPQDIMDLHVYYSEIFEMELGTDIKRNLLYIWR